MRDAWQRLAHVFSVEQEHTTPDDSPVIWYNGPRYTLSLLNKHPVEVLVVERGHIRLARTDPVPERWELLISKTREQHRPLVVLEMWDISATTWDNGPSGQPIRVRWEQLGYSTRMRAVNATNVGGAISQRRLVITRGQLATNATGTVWVDQKG